MGELVRERDGRISRRAGLGLGIGWLGLSGLGGRAWGSQTPPPDSFCPIGYGGNYNGTYYYYFCLCSGGSVIGGCVGVALPTPRSMMVFGCPTGHFVNSHCIRSGGSPPPPPPSKQLPMAGSKKSPVLARASAYTATPSNPSDGNLIDPVSQFDVTGIPALPGAGMFIGSTTDFPDATGKPQAVVGVETLYVVGGRNVACLEIKLPASTVVHTPAGGVSLFVGQEISGTVTTNGTATTILDAQGCYAHAQIGPSGGPRYHIFGTRAW